MELEILSLFLSTLNHSRNVGEQHAFDHHWWVCLQINFNLVSQPFAGCLLIHAGGSGS